MPLPTDKFNFRKYITISENGEFHVNNNPITLDTYDKGILRKALNSSAEVHLGFSESFINPISENNTYSSNSLSEVSHDVVCSYEDKKRGIREYHVLMGTELGKGNSGVVVPAPLKITVDPDNITICRVNDVAKIQHKQYEQDVVEEATQEAKIQNLFFPVKSVISYNRRKTAITIMKRAAGKQLSQEVIAKLNFNQRIDLIQKIAIQLDIIHKKYDLSYVHNDLKLENIIYDPDTGEVEIIDFEFASVSSTKIDGKLGTPLYMAPETLDDDRPIMTFSDINGFGCLAGIILGASNIFSDKNQFAASVMQQLNGLENRAEMARQACIRASYNFDGILTNYTIPEDVTPDMLEEIKNLVTKEMVNQIPEKRPTAEMIVKFFQALNIRRQYNQLLNQLKKSIEELPPAVQLSPNYTLKINKILTKLANIQLPKNENYPLEPRGMLVPALRQDDRNYTKLVFQYRDVYQDNLKGIKDLTLVINKIDELKLKISLDNLHEAFTKSENNGSKCIADRSNSSGLKQIVKILEQKDISPEKKLEKIVNIARKKTTPSWRNEWSRMSFFGKGRDKDAEQFYENLANLSKYAKEHNLTNKENPQMTNQLTNQVLTDITNNLAGRKFSH